MRRGRIWSGSQTVFSPNERRVRQNLIAKSWQRRNPEKVKAQRRRRWLAKRDEMMAANREWKRNHRPERNAQLRQATKEMRPYYLRALLRLRGVTNPTPQDMENQRQRVLSCRRKRMALKSSRILSIVLACASLAKK